MTFEEWINRPVYKAQVHTAKTLGHLLGLPDGPIATTGEHPFMYFRVVQAYRCSKALALRKAVADKVRETRKNGTYKLEGVTL
jgi:hypothetical protein